MRAGNRGVGKVEVSVDGGGSWSQATLNPALSPYTWVLWASEIVLSARSRPRLIVRAYDGNGVQQSAVEEDAPPSGASGLHSRILFNVIEAPG